MVGSARNQTRGSQSLILASRGTLFGGAILQLRNPDEGEGGEALPQ